MADSWGGAWGSPSAWGSSWGSSPVVVADEPRGGAARYYPKKRKKPIEVIRWSDFETREKRAEALAQALATTAIPIKTFVEEEDMDEIDDEILLKALTVLLH